MIKDICSGIMVDLETLGTSPGSTILSIGAVRFNQSGIVGDGFHVCVDAKTCQGYGLTIDPSTVFWWLDQSPQARAGVTRDGVNLKSALEAFCDFYYASGGYIWGCGAGFDVPILEAAIKAVGIPVPWMFWKSMCFRTVREAYPDVEYERHGVAHNALDDARTQALHLIKIANSEETAK